MILIRWQPDKPLDLLPYALAFTWREGAVSRIDLERAYPGIDFRPRTYNWWARLTRVPPECIHLEADHAARDWMALLVPDTVYLRGKAAVRRKPPRQEVSLCRACLRNVLLRELPDYMGRVAAFEPDPEMFTQYFFVSDEDFHSAGAEPAVAAAVSQRLEALGGACERCSSPAKWLWFSREEVSNLDDTAAISNAPGRQLCATHGADAICNALIRITEANLFFVNVPYGESGVYFWI